MSSKGKLPQTRNDSGQIEGECNRNISDPLNLFKNGEYGSIITDSVLPDSNQDVAEDSVNSENITTGVLEIASSNFILSSSRINSDVSVSVDDWFKHKSEGNMDLDSVLAVDGMEVNDLESYHYAASNDSTDMCVVTNICDMGLGFELPVNMCVKCNHSMDECECDGGVDNEFETSSFLDFSKSDAKNVLIKDSSPKSSVREDLSEKMNESDGRVDSEYETSVFLEEYGKNDVKNMLVKVSNPKLSVRQDLLGVKEKDISDSYVVHFQEKVSKESKDTHSKESDWNDSDDVYGNSQSVILNGEKITWESLSRFSHHSSDFESEKDVDFSQFSLLTFQVENNVEGNIINALSQVHSVSDNNTTMNSVVVSEGCVLSETLVESTNQANSADQRMKDSAELLLAGSSEPKDANIKTDTSKQVGSCTLPHQKDLSLTSGSTTTSSTPNQSITATVNKPAPLNALQSTNSRSLIRPTQNIAPSSKSNPPKKYQHSKSGTSLVGKVKTSVVGSENETSNTKKAPSMTIIAISTDKSNNTTEIMINTSQGEQKFRGKTSDFIKATSKLFTNKSGNNKISQKLNLSTVDLSKEEFAALLGSETDIQKNEKAKAAADEQPVTDALATLGVDMSSIICVTPGGVDGYKLWACPVQNCNKLYPRLSLLKVHILSHYGVRPFRCDVPGCHWTFCTFVKLKRHKETHLKRKAFVCPVPNCGHRFTTIYNLKTHRKLHERPAKVQCPVVGCDAHFQTKRAVELHIKKHGISHAPYQCTFVGCGKRYYSSNTLNSHARSHQHREEEVRCQWPDCGKWFDKPCRLKAHMRTHTGDKPYLCTFQNCGWAFSSASKLKRHQQKHTNERKFRCSHEGCGKSFMRSEHLKQHKQTHFGERSYHCTVENCGVKFSAKSSLYVHLKKHKQQMKDVGSLQTTEKQSPSNLQPLLKSTSDRLSEQCVTMWEYPEDGDAKQVDAVMDAKSVFHCPVESCPRAYSCKASLRQHLLKHHTQVLASDANKLGYVTSLLLTGNSSQQVLLSRSDGQTTASEYGLATVPTYTLTVSEEDLSRSGLLTPNGLFESSSYNPEFISTDLLSGNQVQNMLVLTEGTTQEVESNDNTGVMLATDSTGTTCVSDADTELHLATESITDPLLLTDYVNQPITLNLSNIKEEEEISEDPTSQAARTHFTCDDVLRKRTQNSHTILHQSQQLPVSKAIRNDCDNIGNNIETIYNAAVGISETSLTESVVGLRDPVAALYLPSDMAGLLSQSSDLGLVLQEESGLQVLLFEGGESQFYTESTINLRDLE